LVLCSIAAVTVIILKSMTLRRRRVVPRALEEELGHFEQRLNDGSVDQLEKEISKKQSSLARLCAVALKNAGRTQGEVQEAVQSSAREEIVRMNSGLPVLEVVIIIAPLLGLLGTASGLVTVFADLGGSNLAIGKGIAMALSTTIVGLAVAVPSVIAHSFFSSQIERMAARLEVLMGNVVSGCHQHMFFKKK